MRHIVALSGGKDSTALALALKEREPENDYEYICTPTGNELPEMFDHWRSLSTLLGQPLRPVTADASLYGLIRQQNALPNWRMRWCTRMLKIEPAMQFYLSAAPCVAYVGLRADEEEREGMYGQIEGVTIRYPLREWGWGIKDVWRYLDEQGVAIPERTDCGLCFYQQITEWWRLWKDHPEVYAEGIELEDLTGHTFRSPGRDTWPASLRELAAEFERGRLPRGDDPRQVGMFGRAGMCRACTL